jgi:N-acetylmuramoyl-L-alanine amidase
MTTWPQFDTAVGALCSWREARGEGGGVMDLKRDALRAVLHAINNRSKKQGKSWAEIVYARLQFSSMTYGQDPQLCNVPHFPDPIFDMCRELADAVYAGQDADLTNGATHYFADSIPMPEWAKTMTETVKICNQTFFKEAA